VKLLVLRLADKLIATSSALATSIKRSGLDGDKIRVIPNGVSLNRFSAADRKYHREKTIQQFGWPSDTSIAIFVGELSYRKGIDVLAKAWKTVPETLAAARLILIGPEPHRDAAVIEQAKLVLQDILNTVAFVGEVAAPEKYLAAADIFVLPSRAEGLPNALIEACAAGLPCIVTDIPDVTSDVVSSGVNGVVIPQEDSVELSREIVRLLSDPNLRTSMGRSARQSAVESFSMDRVVEGYIRLYEELAEQ
jgi:glycosyltransferase involved in cell wall biosynthesis